MGPEMMPAQPAQGDDHIENLISESIAEIDAHEAKQQRALAKEIAHGIHTGEATTERPEGVDPKLQQMVDEELAELRKGTN